jgi:hypothetical protein
MPTWRIHVVAPDVQKAKEFKEAKENFKALYSEAGTKVTFEFPASGEKAADELAARARALGYKADKEQYVDPLENVEGTAADFW